LSLLLQAWNSNKDIDTNITRTHRFSKKIIVENDKLGDQNFDTKITLKYHT
jgi:ATP-dependent Zn protease